MTTDPTPTVIGTIKPTHRHVKRGNEYQHIGTARIQSDVPLQDMDRVEVYLGSGDDDLWVRRQVEFHDGRFAAITPAPTDAEPVPEAELDEAWKSGFNAGFGEAMLTKDATALAAHDQRIRREVWEEAADALERAGTEAVFDASPGSLHRKWVDLLRARASKEGR